MTNMNAGSCVFFALVISEASESFEEYDDYNDQYYTEDIMDDGAVDFAVDFADEPVCDQSGTLQQDPYPSTPAEKCATDKVAIILEIDPLATDQMAIDPTSIDQLAIDQLAIDHLASDQLHN